MGTCGCTVAYLTWRQGSVKERANASALHTIIHSDDEWRSKTPVILRTVDSPSTELTRDISSSPSLGRSTALNAVGPGTFPDEHRPESRRAGRSGIGGPLRAL
jgi:hypothetical protein